VWKVYSIVPYLSLHLLQPAGGQLESLGAPGDLLQVDAEGIAMACGQVLGVKPGAIHKVLDGQ